MDTLPPELPLHLIQFLPLTSLIAIRGVNTRWRTLAQTASLHPARKALLDLYLAAIVHHNFPTLVHALRPHLHHFDRKAYIANLTSCGCVLPDLFELWILEWPSKAVHFWAWPGLDRYTNVYHEHYYANGNLLAKIPPTIDAIPLPKKEVMNLGDRTCRGLALWQGDFGDDSDLQGVCQLWMVVDPNEWISDRKVGRLLWTYAELLRVPGSYIPGPKKIVYDTPFGSPTDFKLIGFLDMLDVFCRDVDAVLEGY